MRGLTLDDNQPNIYGTSKLDQKRAYDDLKGKKLRVGDKWYLINSDWFTKWLNYLNVPNNDSLQSPSLTNSSSSCPAPDKINNKSLISFNPITSKSFLKESLNEELDYHTVCEELWKYLVNIYGIARQEDIIERVVIDDSLDKTSSSLKIEVRRVTVSLTCNYAYSKLSSTYSSSDSTVPAAEPPVITEELSRQTTLEQITDRIRTMFKVPSDKQVRLFYKSTFDNTRKLTRIEYTKDSTLNSSGYGMEDVILLDVEDETGGWISDRLLAESKAAVLSVPPPAPALTNAAAGGAPQLSTGGRVSSITTRSSYDYSYSNRHGADYRPGLCGLSNLGNTCFMNSALQCMSNVPVLTDYFRSDKYKGEINKVNPLGRRGEIAESYADLINEMWSGQNSYTIPRNFKLNISRFAPQFTGYQQQDSQELLAFLLDGLHEDLNRIMKKPYVEMGSHVGKTDEEFAEESWQDHKKRNDSIIVDTFHGLLKSTLNCMVCNEISIKFDPFCYLSLPLPTKKERFVEIYFVPLESNSSLVKYKLSVLKNGNIQDLCGALEIHTGIPKNRMVVGDVYANKFFKIYEPSEPVSSIRERDEIYIYELATNLNNTDYLKVKLYLREKGNYIHQTNGFGLPIFYMVPKTKLTNGSLYQHTLKVLKRFINFSSEEINSKLNSSLNVNDDDLANRMNDDEEDRQVISNHDNESTNDSDRHDENINDDDSDVVSSGSANSLRTSERLRIKNSQKNKLFNLILAKNENVDYENSQPPYVNDDAPFEWQTSQSGVGSQSFYSSSSSQSSNGGQILSLVADFPKNFADNSYNKHLFDEVTEHASCNAQFVKKKDVISLADCFNLYTKTEELSEQDYWYCSKCKKHQASTKKFDLWSLPQVLVVHLKRFSYSRLYRDKLDTLVEFPLTDLDITNYLINKNTKTETKYNLIAVSNHYGSLGGGHYTAYGQNRFDSKWYYFDDSSVTSSDESSVCTPAAYLLVYLRKDLHEKLSGGGESVALNRSNSNSYAEKMDC